jgi:hypothetical protein
MINPSLQAFANKVQKVGRISCGDIKRLQRDILPDGINSRDEAELLLTLEQTVSRTDRAFSDWLVAMMVDFVVWGTRPTGVVDADTAAWLASFTTSHTGTRTMRRFSEELTREMEHVAGALPSPPRTGTSGDPISRMADVEPAALAA